MLQGTVTKVTGDGEVFTLRADDGRDYDIRPADIRDVEVEIAEDVQVAIAYVGAPLGDLKDGNHHGQCHEQLYHGDGRRTGTQLFKG